MISIRCQSLKFVLLFLTWGLIPSSSVLAQERKGSSPSDYRLKVDVNLISVLATVTTAEGAWVPNLKQEDFQIFENGKPQTIAIFGKELDQPLRLSLLFDSSVSIATEVKVEREAAIEFLHSILRPVDRVSVFQVSEDVEELVKGEYRIERIGAAIRSIKPRGGTSLYDAIYLAADSLSNARGHKVILVISDGTDTTSQVRINDCLKACQNSEALVYSLVVQPIKSEPGRNLGGEHAMIFLSEKTGGRFFKIYDAQSCQTTFTTISDELRTQYYMAYYPKPQFDDEEFRKIEVKVNNPTYKIRAREGYYITR
jgi:Ca-activated chloride channel family protein